VRSKAISYTALSLI